jgi:predicted nucleic acid-binding protein
MIVVADTSPLNYLVLMGDETLLQRLFGSILIPPAVVSELIDSNAPEPVRHWANHLPDWVSVESVHGSLLRIGDPGRGETEGILLAEAFGADLILIDDAAARAEAERRHLTVTGTLGVLRLAAQRKLIRLPDAFARLSRTNFRVAPRLLEELLDEVRGREVD